MSLKYKFEKFDDQNTQNKTETSESIERFETSDNVRNLCLVETSGKQTFLNYSYLIFGEYSPDEGARTDMRRRSGSRTPIRIFVFSL